MGSETKRMKAIIKDPQHIRRVVESVQVFHMRQDFVDLCFVCARGHRVFCHKLLMSSVSPPLKQMLMEIPANIDIITIHLPDVEARILRLLMEFLYEGELRLECATDYKEFNNVKALLGVVLHRSTPSETTIQQQPEVPLSAQPLQPIFYMQAPGTNGQGQMQYLLATPAMMQMAQAAAPGQLMQVAQATATGQMMQVNKTAAPGQMMQVTQAGTPGQMMQATQSGASGQMMQVTQAVASGQMMQVTPAQTPGQVMQVAAPNTSMAQGQIMQMSPANGQMVQVGSQVVSTSIQQNNMMQVVPQNNTQVMPMVVGNQMVQCSSQMVVQAGQPTMMNNNQIQNNNQNQTAQPNQRPQYVMTSTSNQVTTSRAQTQYTQPQVTQQRIAVRSRTTAQVAQPARTNAVNNTGGNSIMEEILSVLQEKCLNLESIETLTARELRTILEPRLGIDLSNQEPLIEQVLVQSFRGGGADNKSKGDKVSSPAPAAEESNSNAQAERPVPAPKAKVTRRRRRRVMHSDNSEDEDFVPSKSSKSRRK